ncbi:MAG: class I SAM-dependent methyltransferase, partial [Actinobacteria bacterium]|nr:class I SAM-dependent methyltransferase [Actinomycetota bacterium]
MATTGYLLAGEDPGVERRRLQVLERLRDPLTVRRLRRLGVTAGWRCLEVGVGAGSIVRWLSDAVGPTGQVLAIDIDIRLLRGLDAANVEVRVQDLLGEHWGLAGFDLVHVRAVLHHLPRRQKQAIARLISALRPGGWLLVEELDMVADDQLQPGPWGQVRAAFAHLPQADYTWAPALPALVADSLIETGTESDVDIGTGSSDVAEFLRLSLHALRAPFLATETVDADLLAA